MIPFQKNLRLFALFRATVTLNLLFALLFRFAEVNSRDLVSVLVVVNIQILIGGLIWVGLGTRPSIDISEFIGMGGALGFGLSLLSSQVLRTVMPFSISWLVFPILLLSALQLFNGYSIGYSLSKVKVSNELFLLFSGTLIALSTSWYWLISCAVAVFLWVVLHYWRASNRESGASNSKRQSVLLVAAGLVSIRAVSDLSSLAEIRHPLWWNLRFGVLQDPDLIFAESMVNSTKNFGNQGNIFFSGLKFYYHWFAFAWEATLGSISDLRPFVVTAIIAPAVTLLVVLCLVFAVAKKISGNVFAAPFAMFAVAMMCAGQITLFRILHPYSFSFNFGLIFVYSLVVLILTSDEIRRVNIVTATFLISLCLIGSKVSYGPILVVGLAASFVWSLFVRQNRQISLLFLISSALAVAVSFTVIYKIGSGSGSDYRISFGDILRQKANLGNGVSFAIVFVTFIAVFAHLMAPTFGLVFLKDIFHNEKRLGILFCIAGGLSGIAFGFLLSDPSETGAYFIQGGLALLVPVSVVASFAVFKDVKIMNRRTQYFLITGFVVCLIGDWYWPIFYDRVWVGDDHYFLTDFAIMIPLFVSILGVVAAISMRPFGINIELKRLLALLLLVSTAGSYFGNAKAFSDKGVWASRNVRFEPADIIAGSNNYRKLLLWLRNNSDQNDIVATNRFCTLTTERPPFCTAQWALPSAIAGRQMLSEGSWTVNIISGMEDELMTRRNLVADFIDRPTTERRTSLLEFGVRWVVVDYAVTKTRDWGDFAQVRFVNKAGAILELAP